MKRIFGQVTIALAQQKNMCCKLIALILGLCLPLVCVVAQEKTSYNYEQGFRASKLDKVCESMRIYNLASYELKLSLAGEVWIDSISGLEGYFEVIPTYDNTYDYAKRSYSSGLVNYKTYAFANSLEVYVRQKGMFGASTIDGDSGSSIVGLIPTYTQREGYETMVLSVVEDIVLYPDFKQESMEPDLDKVLILKAGSRITITTRIPKLIRKPWDSAWHRTGDIVYSSGLVDRAKPALPLKPSKK